MMKRITPMNELEVKPHSTELVFDLVDKAIELNGGYFVGLPKVLRSEPMILTSDDMLDRLTGLRWQIAFQDGRQDYVQLVTLACFLFVMQDIRRQMTSYQEAVEAGDCTATFNINVSFTEGQVMKPDTVRRLLKEMIK